jgi:hypothetical protein
MLVCSAAWLFSAPAEVESPDDGSRRTRLLAPGNPLGHDPHWLASAPAIAYSVREPPAGAA